jgi:hypothetical protein
VRSPSCRAKIVLPLPAQPRMTTRTMFVGYRKDISRRNRSWVSPWPRETLP